MYTILVVVWILTFGLSQADKNPLNDVFSYIETTKREGCDVSELSNSIAWCNGTLTKQNSLPEHTLCQSYKADSDDIICVKHKWVKLKYAERRSGRFRRSIIDVLIQLDEPCTLFCNNTAINTAIVKQVPEFQVCPSSVVLYPELGLTSVIHIWVDPVATDSDGQITSLVQAVGPARNTSLQGSVSPGTDYIISYIATDDDNLKWVCAFTVTSEIPACPPIVHIDNGITTCTNYNFRNSVCNITCDSGYYLNTTFSTVTCQENGTWSNETESAQCVTVTCTSDPIESGNFTNMQFVCEQNADAFDVICWAQCLSGYTLRNDDTENSVIASLQATLSNAMAQYNASNFVAQNARDTADQAINDFNTALDVYNTSLQASTEVTQELQQENQILTDIEQQLTTAQTNLSVAQHNLSEAITNNDSSANALQNLVTSLTSEVETLTDSLEAQTILVHNLTEDTLAATTALEAASTALINAETIVNETEAEATEKEALAQQDLNAVVAATAAYDAAVSYSETGDKVITAYARCLPNGTWDIPGNPYCTDITQPEINCIPLVLKYLNKDEDSTVVTWNIPVASDNSGTVSVERISGIEPGTSLSVGQYEVVYQAVDGDGNRSPFCNLLINVEEHSCGNVTGLINDTNMDYACDGYEYGSRCNVSCDFSYDLTGQSSFTCELNSTSGDIEAYWDWEFPSCTEVVCQLPDAPANGQIDCTDYVEGSNGTIGNGTATGNATGSDTIGITCTVICDTGYILQYNSLYVYTCVNDTGWNSVDFPTMCIESGVEQDATYTLQLTYNAADTCVNEDILGFENDWSAILGQEVTSFPACTMGYTCTVGIVNSNCTNDIVAVEFFVLVKCDDPPDDAGCGLTVDLMSSLYSSIITSVQNGAPNSVGVIYPPDDAGCDLSVDLMSSLYSSIITSVQNGALNSVGVMLTQDWLTAISSDLPQCMDGSVLVGRYCERCGPGYFYATSLDSCLQCGLDSYNDIAGRKSCTTCPGQTNTRARGATSVTDCIDECSPGSYSPDGIVPCILCDTGYYQEEWGTMSCNQCPPDAWTTIPGANSSSDCIAFDIFFVDAEPNFLLTTIGEQMSVIYWILNHQQPGVTLGAYYSEDDPNDYAFALNTEPNAQLLFNSWDNEPTGIMIEPSVWVMIGITWNWPTKKLMLYKNGELAHNTTLNSAVALPDKLMMSSNRGTVLAGLSVTDSVVTADEMLQSSMNCTRKLTGATFTMDNLANLRKFNVKYIPTVCNEINATTINHCDFNACQNGAICVHNDTAGYTCNCTQEYGGPFCEELLVHGGWSAWIFSTACSVTCGSGTQERYRLCNNPSRSNYGDDCVGNNTDTIECILDPCQECSAPGREGGATCVLQNDTCSPVCPAGYILPSGQNDQNYACGYTTNYVWLPLADLPVCSEIQKPNDYTCSMTFTLNRDVLCSVVNGVTSGFQTIANGLHCVINNVQCTITVSITGCVESRRRRQTTTNSRLVVLIVVPIVDTDPLDFTTFYLNNSIANSIQEIVNALTDIEGTVTEIQTDPGVLSVNYTDGNFYTVVVNDPATDIIIVTSINCNSGQVPTSGVCAACQQGTYQVGDYCVYCDRGTYQSDPSQTSCISCLDGYTTDNIGARTETDCYQIPVPPVPPEPADYTVIIIAVVSCVVVIALVLLIVCCSRRFYLTAKHREKFDMEADQISLYTDFPDIAYNVYFKRRQVLGFDEDGFPIISREPVKNGDIAQYSDAEDEIESHRTPTPLPKREPFAYPTDYVDPPFTYDPYRNLDTTILLPEEPEHKFDFPVLKESIRFRVPGRRHLQNAYPLQQFGVKGKAKSRHRKHLPNPMNISYGNKLPQLMFRPEKTEVSIDQAIKEQKRIIEKERQKEREKEIDRDPTPVEQYEITPHDRKAPPTLKLHKAHDNLSAAIEKRSPRGKTISPRSPRHVVKKGKPGSRGSQRSARSTSSAKPSKRYQTILETSPRPATSASTRSLKSAMSTRSRSTRADSPRSVSIHIPTHDTDKDDDIPHPKPSKLLVPKLNIHFPSKSMLKTSSMFETKEGRPATGRKSVIFQDEGTSTRPSTSATRFDDGAPFSPYKSAEATIVAPNASRHKPPYKPYGDIDLYETYRPESHISRPDSPLYRPVSSSTRASSPTFHPKPVLHSGVTVQRRSDFIMYNPPTNLKFNVGMPPPEHKMKFMKPPPFMNRVKPKDRKDSRVSQMSVKFDDDSDDEFSISSSFFMTEIPESPLPSRTSQTSRASHVSHGSQPVRPRRASKVRFKKESPPPGYNDAKHDPVIETARENDETDA